MKKFLSAALLSLGCATANAGVIFFDDFEAETPDNLIHSASGMNQTTFTNWTVDRGTVDLVWSGEWDNKDCHNGTGYCVDLDGSSLDAGRMTSIGFGLDSGDYTFSFKMSGNQRTNDTDTMRVTLDGILSDTITLGANDPWQTMSYDFSVLDSMTSFISFNHYGGDYKGIFIDDVSVVEKIAQVPEPATFGLLGLGLLGLAAARRQERKA